MFLTSRLGRASSEIHVWYNLHVCISKCMHMVPQGNYKRTEQTHLARSTPLEPEDIEAAASGKKGRGGRGRGRGRGAGIRRSGSSKNLKRLRTFKRPAKASSSRAEEVKWDDEMVREWYRFQGWSDAEIEEWYHGPAPQSKQAQMPKKRLRGKSRPVLEDDDVAEEEEAEEEASTPKVEKNEKKKKEVSFARRPPPKTVEVYKKWDAVRTTFADQVSFYVYPPFKFQARITIARTCHIR